MSEELRAALGKIANSGRASHPILDAFQMSEIAAAALRASTDTAAEPVAWMLIRQSDGLRELTLSAEYAADIPLGWGRSPLYTHPAPAEPAGLRAVVEAIKSEASAATSSDGKERDPWAIGRILKMADRALTTLTRTDEAISDDVVALVCAGRRIMERGYVSTSIPEERDDAEALDKALEAFASRVCWDDDGGTIPEAHASPCTCGLATDEASTDGEGV